MFIPDEEKLSKSAEVLNEQLAEQEKKVNAAREAFEKLKESKIRGKGTKLAQAEAKLNAELDKQVELRNALNALEATPSFEDKSAKIATEALVKIQRE